MTGVRVVLLLSLLNSEQARTVLTLCTPSIQNKSDISCLKNQPDAFPVQYTQLSLDQAIKLQL